jgi:hypothetical protein
MALIMVSTLYMNRILMQCGYNTTALVKVYEYQTFLGKNNEGIYKMNWIEITELQLWSNFASYNKYTNCFYLN